MILLIHSYFIKVYRDFVRHGISLLRFLSFLICCGYTYLLSFLVSIKNSYLRQRLFRNFHNCLNLIKLNCRVDIKWKSGIWCTLQIEILTGKNYLTLSNFAIFLPLPKICLAKFWPTNHLPESILRNILNLSVAKICTSKCLLNRGWLLLTVLAFYKTVGALCM